MKSRLAQSSEKKRVPKSICTLCLLVQKDQILLGKKKVGLGAGKWNGFGGKVEALELISDAAVREMREESGLTITAPRKVGLLRFFLIDRSPVRELEVHVFFVDTFKGVPRETEEMWPRWFSLENIPYDEMWPDDRHWLPLFLKGKKFRGTFTLGHDDAILRKKLDIVDNL